MLTLACMQWSDLTSQRYHFTNANANSLQSRDPMPLSDTAGMLSNGRGCKTVLTLACMQWSDLTSQRYHFTNANANSLQSRDPMPLSDTAGMLSNGRDYITHTMLTPYGLEVHCLDVIPQSC